MCRHSNALFLFNRLTAFVAKVFCQAETITEKVVDESGLNKTLDYIAKNNKNGVFTDNEPVIHREMQVN